MISFHAEYIFDDYISSIEDEGEHALVTFGSGNKRNFDVVVGADGMGSKTCRIVFREENSLIYHLGVYGCYFTVPYDKADGPYSGSDRIVN
jgi:2-polyprenyl-6-methoxyphenol hydroxylase-like FAD-dependent oxidoreductase